MYKDKEYVDNNLLKYCSENYKTSSISNSSALCRMRCWLQDLAERGMRSEIFPELDLRLWRYQGCLFWPSSRRRRRSQGLELPPLKLQSVVGFSNSSVKRAFCEQSYPLSSPSSFSPFITYYFSHGTHCLASLSLGQTRNPLFVIVKLKDMVTIAHLVFLNLFAMHRILIFYVLLYDVYF